MGAPQQFSLRWNNYSQHLITAFEDLRSDDELTDVTLSCDGKRIKAHRVLLSACSLYFKETFRETPCKHPVVILNGVNFADLQAVVTFMYNGQVNITQERLSSFLQTAELLQIKGLTDINDSAQSPSAKKRLTGHTGLSASADTTVSNAGSIHSADDSSIISTGSNPSSSQRSPTLKRKRIGPASFMQMQLSHATTSDSQVPAPIQSGSTTLPKTTRNPESASSSPGSLLHPETVILPSASLVEPVDSSNSDETDAFGHGRIKYESEDLDDDYEKSNISEADGSQNDLIEDTQDRGTLGHFLAGTSSQSTKSGGVNESSGLVTVDKRWLAAEKNAHRRSTTESNTTSSSPTNHRAIHLEESTESNASNQADNFSMDEGSMEGDGYEIMDNEFGEDNVSTDRNFSGIRGDLPPLKPIKKTHDLPQYTRTAYGGSTSSSSAQDNQGLQMFGLTSDPMYVLKIANADRHQSSSCASVKLPLPPFRPRSASKAMSTGSQESGPYICDICGKTYAHHRSLNDHKKSHTGATLCHYCLRSFSKVANLRAHVLAQHKDKIPQTLSKVENI